MILSAASASSKEPNLRANQHYVWSTVPQWLSVHSVGLPIALGCPPNSGVCKYWALENSSIKAQGWATGWAGNTAPLLCKVQHRFPKYMEYSRERVGYILTVVLRLKRIRCPSNKTSYHIYVFYKVICQVRTFPIQ